MAAIRDDQLITEEEVAIGRDISAEVESRLAEMLGSKEKAAKIVKGDEGFSRLITNLSKQRAGTLPSSDKPIRDVVSGIKDILEGRQKEAADAADQAADLAAKAAEAASKIPKPQSFGPYPVLDLGRVVEGGLITASSFNAIIVGVLNHDARLRELEGFATRESAVETLGFGKLFEQVRTLQQEVVFLTQELNVLRDNPHVPPDPPIGLRNLLLQMQEMARTLKEQQAEIDALQKVGVAPPRPPVIKDPPVFETPPIIVQPPADVVPTDVRPVRPRVFPEFVDATMARDVLLEKTGATDLIKIDVTGHVLPADTFTDPAPDVKGSLDVRTGAKPTETILDIPAAAGMKAADVTEIVVGDRSFKAGEFVAKADAGGNISVTLDVAADKGTPLADMSKRAGAGVQIIGKGFSLGSKMPIK